MSSIKASTIGQEDMTCIVSLMMMMKIMDSHLKYNCYFTYLCSVHFIQVVPCADSSHIAPEVAMFTPGSGSFFLSIFTIWFAQICLLWLVFTLYSGLVLFAMFRVHTLLWFSFLCYVLLAITLLCSL